LQETDPAPIPALPVTCQASCRPIGGDWLRAQLGDVLPFDRIAIMGSLGFDQTSLIRVVGYRLAATGANRVNRRVFPSLSSKGNEAGHQPLQTVL